MGARNTLRRSKPGHTRRGDRYFTAASDLTPVRNGTGPSRLLAVVEGRSKQVFKTWLDPQSPKFRDGIEVVAMDGFSGFKTATTEELPAAVAVMDQFHVVALAGDAVDRCRQRIQQFTCGHRGRSGDPFYGIRRVLRTGVDLLTDRQVDRLRGVFAVDDLTEVEATWVIYQRIVAAYRTPDRAAAKAEFRATIDAICRRVPAELTKVITLCPRLKRRAAYGLAYFDLTWTSSRSKTPATS